MFFVALNMFAVYSSVTSVVYAASWLMFYLWLGLLVYNIVSALFGIGRMRIVYVGLLRLLYKVSGLTGKGS